MVSVRGEGRAGTPAQLFSENAPHHRCGPGPARARIWLCPDCSLWIQSSAAALRSWEEVAEGAGALGQEASQGRP